MKIYLVGGAVRDRILGLDPKDLDYVVTGSTTEEMSALGYKQVGAHFPVFLHPQSGDEYALARKETKVTEQVLNSDFKFDTFNVSLEDDLARRDLTINSIAMDENTYIDPFNGIEDLKNKILRHTSPAFIEDPLRVLRVARFAARFDDFIIHPSTIEIMKKLVNTPEFRQLSSERVFGEMNKALKQKKPSRFFEVLKEVGGLDHFFPELKQLIDIPQRPEYHPEGCVWTHTMLVVDHAASANSDIRCVYSALVHDLGKGITPAEKLPSHTGHEEAGLPLVRAMGERLHVPNDWTEAALVVTAHHLKIHRLKEMRANSIVKMFYEIDAFRKPHLVSLLARCCEADDMGKNRADYDNGILLEEYFKTVRDISFKDIREGLKGKAIAHEIRSERVRMLSNIMKTSSAQPISLPKKISFINIIKYQFCSEIIRFAKTSDTDKNKVEFMTGASKGEVDKIFSYDLEELSLERILAFIENMIIAGAEFNLDNSWDQIKMRSEKFAKKLRKRTSDGKKN